MKANDQRPDLARLVGDLQARVVALEVMVTMLLQRAPEGGQAMAAALISIDDLHAAHLEGATPADVDAVDEHFAVARTRMQQLAQEVIAFRRGEGVELRR